VGEGGGKGQDVRELVENKIEGYLKGARTGLDRTSILSWSEDL
jgi:hypothetical protein